MSTAVTRESVRELAREQAADPTTVREVIHYAFNADPVSGGFAFLRDEVLLICGVGGGRTWTVDPGDDDARRDAIDAFWRVAQRHSLRKRLAALEPEVRVAVAGLVAGVRSVRNLDAGALRDDEAGVDPWVADAHLAYLRFHTNARTQAEAVLAVERALRDRGRSTLPIHPCPVCGYPALGDGPYARAVCEVCELLTVCEHGREVRGAPTSRFGGFVARHADDESECEATTASGAVVIGERAVMMTGVDGSVVVEVVA
ncbi:hypothetical protein C8046_13370 [Serinibacter arcticus]|uniref:Uncharacterized protein n=1 Tax=Serinibacter arcticus TaxID=1655435 RepID=A0A2U1ZWZ0_9MICO|nr:hypothetical protein [Serinibacter arcticus]PWD51499.1 hypothetical protein C8046_13370 [Serinibacter arcticus]